MVSLPPAFLLVLYLGWLPGWGEALLEEGRICELHIGDYKGEFYRGHPGGY